ncbi:uncharacterized protein LOC133722718 [Rosa rugosa]|uniref:uncharacterized protein LOC133722718 n=1 Tax=Rosa rugosa TaxID=74645 RepID=UPI002B40A95F|nr:uncharacterized protein LOC133722718 [Rosa rugosa]
MWIPVYSFGIEEVLYSKDKFYAVGAWNKLICLDTTAQSNSYVKKLIEQFAPCEAEYIKRYIVDLNEKKLMLVQRYMIREGGKFVTQKFKIFELSFDKCDAALFVGNMNTISVLASSSSRSQADCIYFNQDNDYLTDYDVRFLTISNDDFGVYNMKTKSISKPFSGDAMTFLVEKTELPPVWVVPTFQL